MTTTVEDFERERRYLGRLAYQMLGSAVDAEDVVQDTFLRWRDAGEPDLDSPRAWFTRTCTRLCLDRLKSAHREREQYVGEWLPEPLLADESESPKLDETLSMALILTIQRLRPAERAAFLLHDVFGYEFTEVAAILDLEPANCRQLAARARRHLERGERRVDADEHTIRRVSEAFFHAVGSGDLEGLRAVLAEDVVLRSDGGGKVAAAPHPIEGVDRVVRFLEKVLVRGGPKPPLDLRRAWFNGAPGFLVQEDGQPASAFHFQVVDGRIAGIYVQRNPEKLQGFRD